MQLEPKTNQFRGFFLIAIYNWAARLSRFKRLNQNSGKTSGTFDFHPKGHDPPMHTAQPWRTLPPHNPTKINGDLRATWRFVTQSVSNSRQRLRALRGSNLGTPGCAKMAWSRVWVESDRRPTGSHVGFPLRHPKGSPNLTCHNQDINVFLSLHGSQNQTPSEVAEEQNHLAPNFKSPCCFSLCSFPLKRFVSWAVQSWRAGQS